MKVTVTPQKIIDFFLTLPPKLLSPETHLKTLVIKGFVGILTLKISLDFLNFINIVINFLYFLN
jgi:hypothetical protein